MIGGMTTLHLVVERLATPLGTMLVLTDDRGRLRAADWEDHEARLSRLLRQQYRHARVVVSHAGGRSAAGRAIEAYFAGHLAALDEVDVETGGTAFQRQVWAALRRIPAGQTASYRDVAADVDRPAAVRAVGLANGANPVSLVVPCHRVIGASGALTGYGGGLERKRWLLEHEGAWTAGRPSVPAAPRRFAQDRL